MSVRHYRSKEWIYVQKEMISNFQSLVTDYFIEQRHREHNLLMIHSHSFFLSFVVKKSIETQSFPPRTYFEI